MTMAEPRPPRRSLVEVRIGANGEGEAVLLCLCDCATATELTLADLRLEPGTGREFAYTCDGCTTSHWFTITTGVPG